MAKNINIVELQKITALKIAEIQDFTGEKLEKWYSETQTAEMADGLEWLVLTDEEADVKAAEEIKESLWAFNTCFIINHMVNNDELDSYAKKQLNKSLQQLQQTCCEDCNALIYAIIGAKNGIDDFVNDAIAEDGRGHFLSYYNGKEEETENFFIYRIN